MSAQAIKFLLLAFSLGWSGLSLALSCAPAKPIEEKMAGIEVIAIVRTEPDVNTRRMNTTSVFKGRARKSYYYYAPLVNPIPTTCCIEILPNTDYVIFTGSEEQIGYSVCGSEGVQESIEPNNGAPPFSMFHAYPYLDDAGQKLLIKMLTTDWPEVRKKWIDGYEDSITRQKYQNLSANQHLVMGGEKIHEQVWEKSLKIEAKLRETFQQILSLWNPTIVEDNR